MHKYWNMAGDIKTKKALSEEVGKYLLDVSKLTFGGVILVGIVNLNSDKLSLIIFGGFFVVFTAIIGFLLIYKGKE